MRLMFEPGQPGWPPQPVFNLCLGVPSLWVGILGVSCAMRNPVMRVFMAGLADDAGIVATAGQDKGHVRVTDQIELLNGPPRRNVISIYPAFIKKQGTGTEPMPFVALWLR
jgi:hypothetical protein